MGKLRGPDVLESFDVIIVIFGRFVNRSYVIVESLCKVQGCSHHSNFVSLKLLLLNVIFFYNNNDNNYMIPGKNQANITIVYAKKDGQNDSQLLLE